MDACEKCGLTQRKIVAPANITRREIVHLAKRVFVFGGDAIGGWDPGAVKEWIVEGEWFANPELLDDAAMAAIMNEAFLQIARVERFLGLRR
tara:strand:- start:96 stop:371 length:276 start_codon:yes stop_codon:yes gene_type:complete